jgi:hypothetical protein
LDLLMLELTRRIAVEEIQTVYRVRRKLAAMKLFFDEEDDVSREADNKIQSSRFPQTTAIDEGIPRQCLLIVD